jgi:hypothetical protein
VCLRISKHAGNGTDGEVCRVVVCKQQQAPKSGQEKTRCACSEFNVSTSSDFLFVVDCRLYYRMTIENKAKCTKSR